MAVQSLPIASFPWLSEKETSKRVKAKIVFIELK